MFCPHGIEISRCSRCTEVPDGGWLHNANAKGRDHKKVYLRILVRVRGGNVELAGVCCMDEESPKTPGDEYAWATLCEAQADTLERGIDLLKRSGIPAVATLMRSARRS